LKAISQKSRNLSPKIISIVEKELKLFYFKAFKRRSKNLLTLELIKECYTDQIKFFINEISDLINKYDKELKKDLVLLDLIKFKKNEGCNKKILETLIIHLQERYNNLNIGPSELKSLLLFED
jgi:CRISPR/Cas system CMR-associated protein Cmr1 (group 7 of RAMP superfamily)